MCIVQHDTSFVVSEAEFYRSMANAKVGHWSHNHGNLGFKKLREATRQADDTLATIIVPLANVMPHKTCTLPTWEKVVEKILPMGTKWEAFLLDANMVGENASLEPILLSI